MSGDDGLISSYLLGELDANEAAAFERQIEADPELREQVVRLRPLVRRLEDLPGDAWEPADPPVLEMPPEAVEVRPGPARLRRRLRLPTLTLRPAAAAGLAALLLAVGAGAGILVVEDGAAGSEDGAVADLVLDRFDDGPADAHGDVFVAAGESGATLDVSGLDPSGPGRFYELWLLDDDGRMIALGSFRVGGDGHAKVRLPIPVPPTRYRYFDVSLQEDNGDPLHSGISVLRGLTAS